MGNEFLNRKKIQHWMSVKVSWSLEGLRGHLNNPLEDCQTRRDIVLVGEN